MTWIKYHLAIRCVLIDDDVGEYDGVCLATSHITSTGDHLVAKWLQRIQNLVVMTMTTMMTMTVATMIMMTMATLMMIATMMKQMTCQEGAMNSYHDDDNDDDYDDDNSHDDDEDEDDDDDDDDDYDDLPGGCSELCLLLPFAHMFWLLSKSLTHL